ncbi:MAG: T9SS type A sorting domain-containing protein, partial [Chitinophagaceae bacterium]
FTVRNVYLQHLAVERQSADSFAIVYKTNSNKGQLIGKEISTGFSSNSIDYDFPVLTANATGNALFSIGENGRYIRVSPVGNGADLLWGAMGKPIGTPVVNGSYSYPLLPFVSLDSQDGTGVISWQDTRNLPANTRSNVFMRHLDNLNEVNYLPPNKKLQALATGATFANPAVLTGASKKYSLIEAYNSLTGTTSPVVEILDNYNLGTIPVSVFENTGVTRTTNGKPYLNRNYTIIAENNPNGGASINVRLFFTTAEFDALKLADPTITNPGLLSVIKQPNASGTLPAEYIPSGADTEIAPVSWLAANGGYYVEIVVTGFSNFFIQKTSSALPVTWLGVQAQWTNTKNSKISWQVADQQNVKDYTVQQSEDGINFSNACNVSASAATSYSCIVPAKTDGINYYRVLQRDLDNKFTYSKTVILTPSGTISLAVHPNPVRDRLYIDGIAGYNILQVADMSGKVIQQQTVLAGLKSIDISHLGPGIYLLTAKGDKGTQTLKFIKQ